MNYEFSNKLIIDSKKLNDEKKISPEYFFVTLLRNLIKNIVEVLFDPGLISWLYKKHFLV